MGSLVRASPWPYSPDLRRWTRLGLVRFTVEEGLDLNVLDNKDAVLFPELVPGPDGNPSMAMIHRPTFQADPGSRDQRVSGAACPDSLRISM